MTPTINVMKPSEVQQKGMSALLDALGPIGMARFLEQYDNGGSGDYTAEKYSMPDITEDEVASLIKRAQQSNNAVF